MKQLLRSFVLPIVIGISACSGSETVEQSEPASESERIAKGDLTTIGKEYSERLITEIRASITVLEAHR